MVNAAHRILMRTEKGNTGVKIAFLVFRVYLGVLSPFRNLNDRKIAKLLEYLASMCFKFFLKVFFHSTDTFFNTHLHFILNAKDSDSLSVIHPSFPFL